MKKDNPTHPGVTPDLYCVQPCAVSPATKLGIFLRRELRVADQHVGVGGIVAQSPVQPLVAMFIVGGIHDDGTVAFDPVADSDLRVIERKGVDSDWKVGVVHLALKNLRERPSGRYITAERR